MPDREHELGAGHGRRRGRGPRLPEEAGVGAPGGSAEGADNDRAPSMSSAPRKPLISGKHGRAWGRGPHAAEEAGVGAPAGAPKAQKASSCR